MQVQRCKYMDGVSFKTTRQEAGESTASGFDHLGKNRLFFCLPAGPQEKKMQIHESNWGDYFFSEGKSQQIVAL